MVGEMARNQAQPVDRKSLFGVAVTSSLKRAAASSLSELTLTLEQMLGGYYVMWGGIPLHGFHVDEDSMTGVIRISIIDSAEILTPQDPNVRRVLSERGQEWYKRTGVMPERAEIVLIAGHVLIVGSALACPPN